MSNVATSLTFATDCTVIGLSVPKPPVGYSILAEAWFDASWDSGSPLDALARLEVGDRILAEATIKSDANSTAGSISPHLCGIISPTGNANFKIQIDHTASRTALDFKSRGIVAQYVKEA
jgi:hypothetical protein